MRTLFAAAVLVLIAAPCPARAEVDCAPYCDYTHDYGPYDLTYIRPGLYAFPVCGPSGDCSPYALHTYPRYRGVRITIRPRRRH
ncbi:MAG TPA: hypothetical protein VEK73_03240 [Xanthobacteraceae bacterium]|nr:hypothetical protein [Xanthobacteraceae bacterium]